jgi:hypothetical protein
MLRRPVIHLKSSSPDYEFLDNGAASDIPTLEASDEEIIALGQDECGLQVLRRGILRNRTKFRHLVRLMLRRDVNSITAYLSTKENMVSHGMFVSAFSVLGFRLIAPALSCQSRYWHRYPLSTGQQRGRMERISMAGIDPMTAWDPRTSGPRIRFTIPRKEVHAGKDL